MSQSAYSARPTSRSAAADEPRIDLSPCPRRTWCGARMSSRSTGRASPNLARPAASSRARRQSAWPTPTAGSAVDAAKEAREQQERGAVGEHERRTAMERLLVAALDVPLPRRPRRRRLHQPQLAGIAVGRLRLVQAPPGCSARGASGARPTSVADGCARRIGRMTRRRVGAAQAAAAPRGQRHAWRRLRSYRRPHTSSTPWGTRAYRRRFSLSAPPRAGRALCLARPAGQARRHRTRIRARQPVRTPADSPFTLCSRVAALAGGGGW